jgi:hypothetical protein
MSKQKGGDYIIAFIVCINFAPYVLIRSIPFALNQKRDAVAPPFLR